MFAYYSSEVVRIVADVLNNVGNERANQFGTIVLFR